MVRDLAAYGVNLRDLTRIPTRIDSTHLFSPLCDGLTRGGVLEVSEVEVPIPRKVEYAKIIIYCGLRHQFSRSCD